MTASRAGRRGRTSEDLGREMPCFPACGPWCVCENDVCVPAPLVVNAVRFRTQDASPRYLSAANGGGGLLVAAAVPAPGPAETFLLAPPPGGATLPNLSRVSFDVASSTFAPLGLRMRTDHTTVVIPGGKKNPPLWTYEVGGVGAAVFVNAGFPDGPPAYRGPDPAETLYTIQRIGAGTGPLANGDTVALRVDSNRGNAFFLRVVSGANQAQVHADARTAGQPGSVFVIELNEVRPTLGWRPADVVCQTCAALTVRALRASDTTRPVAGAGVIAQVPNHAYTGTTGGDGRTRVRDAAGRDCVPAGQVPVEVSANRFRRVTTTATIPSAGAVEIAVELPCTVVSGRVVDQAMNGIPGVTVVLRDADRSPLRDVDGNPLVTTTRADGTFVFSCVPHGFVQVWTLADPSQLQHVRTIGPDADWTTVLIVIAAQTCGDLIGSVTDGVTGATIPGASVTESGGRTTTTDANGEFVFACVRPPGPNTVFATAPGYGAGFELGVVPASGASAPVPIRLFAVQAAAVAVRLDWGTQPRDLDSHLSGPDGAGGRFHCMFSNRTPVPFVALDRDDTDSTGPETTTISRTAAGTFEAGTYRFWVHNFADGNTFAGSQASVTISSVDQNGGLTQIGRWDLTATTGDPTDDLWNVVELTIPAAGAVTAAAANVFLPGTANTVL